MAASATKKTAAKKKTGTARKTAHGGKGSGGSSGKKADATSSAGSAKGTPRVLWKGAISFGLVHIPVALYAATVSHGVDFDWLDKRSMDPVGYKRINKRTGREITRENIVKGIEHEDGQYVVLSDEEIADAYPKSTQTIDIESFVPAESVPFVFLERPYYLAPINRGGKVYALLRETLQRSGRVGLARVVISSRQHLAMLVPSGPGMVLNLLRWSEDLRPWKSLPLPPESMKAAGVSDRELKMATELIEDMSADFEPEAFHDSFTERIMALVKRKVEAGKTETVADLEPMEEEPGAGAKVVDLTELLQRSLRKGGSARKGGESRSAADEDGEAKAEPQAAAAKNKRRAPAKKTASAARKRA